VLELLIQQRMQKVPDFQNMVNRTFVKGAKVNPALVSNLKKELFQEVTKQDIADAYKRVGLPLPDFLTLENTPQYPLTATSTSITSSAANTNVTSNSMMGQQTLLSSSNMNIASNSMMGQQTLPSSSNINIASNSMMSQQNLSRSIPNTAPLAVSSSQMRNGNNNPMSASTLKIVYSDLNQYSLQQRHINQIRDGVNNQSYHPSRNWPNIYPNYHDPRMLGQRIQPDFMFKNPSYPHFTPENTNSLPNLSTFTAQSRTPSVVTVPSSLPPQTETNVIVLDDSESDVIVSKNTMPESTGLIERVRVTPHTPVTAAPQETNEGAVIKPIVSGKKSKKPLMQQLPSDKIHESDHSVNGTSFIDDFEVSDEDMEWGKSQGPLEKELLEAKKRKSPNEVLAQPIAPQEPLNNVSIESPKKKIKIPDKEPDIKELPTGNDTQHTQRSYPTQKWLDGFVQGLFFQKMMQSPFGESTELNYEWVEGFKYGSAYKKE
jgi:hypothetical protein